MKDIEVLAKKFRNAIEEVRNEGGFSRDNNLSFDEFPVGCCGDTCDLLAQFLLDNNIITYYTCGTYRGSSQTHGWLSTDKHSIIDITGDQFKEATEFLNFDKPVYVGEETDFHKLFEVNNKRECTGLDSINSLCKPIFKKLYTKIIDRIK